MKFVLKMTGTWQVDMAFETVKELFGPKWFDIPALKTGLAAGGTRPEKHFRETSNRGEHTEFEKSR